MEKGHQPEKVENPRSEERPVPWPLYFSPAGLLQVPNSSKRIFDDTVIQVPNFSTR